MRIASELLQRYGDIPLEELRERASCDACGSKHVVLWEMSLDD